MTMRRPNGFLIILMLIPLATLLRGFTPEHGFLGLPRFGGPFREQALEPVRQYAPPVQADDQGYDGQFYAQIALDPTLSNPQLRAACDNLSYRAKRIGLPALAYLLGGGQAWWILQVYSLLNLIFWLGLLVALLKTFGDRTLVSRAMLIGILWNAGVLVSLGRALTDLPALSLGVLALLMAETGKQGYKRCSHLIAAMALLVKETSLLSLGGWLNGKLDRFAYRQVLVALCIVAPTGLWSLYVRWKIGEDVSGMGNFAFPFYGFLNKLGVTWSETLRHFPRVPLLELIAPWSIVAQCYWMVRYRDFQSRWWYFGIGYVLLAIVIGPWVWATQSAYARCLLPLTVSFNVLLAKRAGEGSHYWRWWIAGNIGLLDRGALGLVLLGGLYGLKRGLGLIGKPTDPPSSFIR